MRVAVAAAGVLIALAGCTTGTSIKPTGHAVELTDVPFFSQQRYQCGPAALATVLVDSGVHVSPEDLVPLVYVPDRKGSFQPELKAAARRYDRLPYVLTPEPAALFAELDAGNPVLVLQNLLFDWWPQWHYAVVVGYDPDRQQLVLRSGTTERRIESFRSFFRSWQGAGYWAVVALQPGQIPASAAPDRYVAMAAESESLIPASAMALVLEAGLQAWPDDADMAFAAANHARLQGDLVAAATRYRQALRIEANHVGALNNFSDLLFTEGCIASAGTQIAIARGLVPAGSPLDPVITATAEAIEAAPQTEDQGPLCDSLTAIRPTAPPELILPR